MCLERTPFPALVLVFFLCIDIQYILVQTHRKKTLVNMMAKYFCVILQTVQKRKCRTGEKSWSKQISPRGNMLRCTKLITFSSSLVPCAACSPSRINVSCLSVYIQHCVYDILFERTPAFVHLFRDDRHSKSFCVRTSLSLFRVRLSDDSYFCDFVPF